MGCSVSRRELTGFDPTPTVNLALALSSLPSAPGGARPRIGLLDLDIFGPSIPKLMGLEGMGEPILTSGESRATSLVASTIPRR